MIKTTLFIFRNDGKPLTQTEMETVHKNMIQAIDVSEYHLIDGVEIIDESKFLNDAV